MAVLGNGNTRTDLKGNSTKNATTSARTAPGNLVRIKMALLSTSTALMLAPLIGATPAMAVGPCTTDTVTVPGTTIANCTGNTSSTVNVFEFGSSFGGVYPGDGPDGGSPNNIDLTSSATITTNTFNSTGLNVFSFGGSTNSVNGGNGGNGGDGGDVSATVSGSITTTEDFSSGVIVRNSGGTAAGVNNGSGGDGGDAGTVNISNSATITTAGRNSHGIEAQSAGGQSGGVNGGGPGGNGGNGSTVMVNSSGTVSAGGVDAHGIWATSTGGYAGGVNAGGNGTAGIAGDVTVNILGGSISGGSGNGWGVRMEGGTDVGLSNAGRISALSGNAIYARGDTATVNNTGTIIGNVTLSGTTSSAFNNNTGGLFESGDTVDLGTGRTLTNAGTVSPGGTGTIRTTSLNGNFVQTAGGRLQVDADWVATTSDRLDVSGTATLDGTVVVNPINFPTTAGLTKQFTILTATAGVTDNGIEAVDTAAVDYTVVHPDAYTTDILAKINFLGVDVGGLPNNPSAVGTTLNKIVGSGATLGFVPALMTLSSQAQLGEALGQLAPGGDGGANSSAMSTGTTFASQLLSCRITGEGDVGAIIREGQCLWARGTVRKLTNDGGRNGVGYKENATFFSAGAQFNLGGPWRIGGGLGYENTDLATNNNSKSEGDRLHLGGVIKYNPGPLFLAASITGGHGWNDNERSVSFGGFNSIATSESDSSFVSGRLTAAYLINFGALYIKPQINVAATYLKRDGYTEAAGGGIALNVRESDDTVFSVTPALEFGAEYSVAGSGIARPFLRAGVKWLDTDSFSTTASFAGAPAGILPFAITSKIDDVVADIGAGIDFITPGDTVLRLQYDGQYGEMTTKHSASAKFSIAF